MDSLLENLRAVVGRDSVLGERDELLVYECDGLPQHRYSPRAVVFPGSTAEVAEVLRVLARERVPFAPRGAGTGLSGGALAVNRGVIIELARMRRLIKLDVENRLAVVETGMINAHVTRAAAPFNLHYVPDPSSQMTCTIGGNLAENAGGIHCLKYGMTVDHVLSARVVLANGEIVELGNLGTDTTGYDLLGVFIGSEGTFGIATEATLRLSPLPQAVRTLLADFTDVNDASRAVSAIIGARLIPSALEMVDGETIRAVERSVFAAGLPLDAEAALLIELDGLEAGLEEEVARVIDICKENRARSVRLAANEEERRKFWAARKGAFGAMGRVSPDLMLQDAVVPRSRLPETLSEIYRISAKYSLRVGNLFHAGDGNLHPVICFDSRDTAEVLRVKEAGREMMEACVRVGGTITGEHGVGLDKSDYLPLIFSADDMDAMLCVRAAFDPTGLCNPGKIIPTSRSCGEARAARRKTGIAEEQEDEGAETEETIQPVVFAQRALDEESSLFVPPRFSKIPFVVEEAQRLLTQIVGDENVSESAPPRTNLSTTLNVSPASNEEACEVLRVAAHEGWAVVPAGGETWLDAGNPLRRADVILSTRRMRRIIEHEPADLVATAQAGLTLSEFNRELGRAGQWLPLDPPDDGRATLGGMAATGICGAQSLGYGAPRSFVIGMRVALAGGKIVKAGGRVVKNVAGYDLCKLFTGSYGTLGLILELTFKLRPVPERTATLVLQAPLASLFPAAQMVMKARLLPVAVEVLSDGLAERISIQDGATQAALLIRFAGAHATVAYQIEHATQLLRGQEALQRSAIVNEDAPLWRELAAVPMQAGERLIWRANLLPTRVVEFLERVNRGDHPACSSSALWHAGLADGRLRVFSSCAEEQSSIIAALEKARAAARALGGTFVLEHAPPEIKSAFDAWGEMGAVASLMRRIKQQLDPTSVLSPGRFIADG